MEVQVELARIIINETSDQQLIVLKERNGSRTLPIVIGIVEIFAIDRRLKGVKTPRPMTHDLLDSVIKHTGSKIEKIVINELQNHTFYATITLSQNSERIEIDSRPSDAIALGVAHNTPIYVREDVFNKAAE